MRLCACLLASGVLAISIGTAQSNGDLSGAWTLNVSRSVIRSLPSPPDPSLRVEQSAKALTISAGQQENGPLVRMTYPLMGVAEKQRIGSSTLNTITKWEGDALLVNTLVSGPQNYTLMERWSRTRDGSTLTIKRTIVMMSGESESLLVYENPAALAGLSTARAVERPAVRQFTSSVAQSGTPPAEPEEYVVDPGTRILMRLTNEINTKSTAVGDRVYLETAVPVFAGGRLIIPTGSTVSGTVTESQRAGRVKGRSSLNVRFDSLTLPNGVTRDLRSRPSAADARGTLDRKEGRIEGESDKGGDARKTAQTTAAGAGIGGLAGAASGHLGMGAGIGAAAGAAAGLGRVFGSRGPDVVLPRGSTMEMTLDRELRFRVTEIGFRRTQ